MFLVPSCWEICVVFRAQCLFDMILFVECVGVMWWLRIFNVRSLLDLY
jgi:hypothetical protein